MTHFGCQDDGNASAPMPTLRVVPVRLRPAPDADVAAALERRQRAVANAGDERLLVRHLLAVLARDHPGASVEVRVPPYAVVQCIAGARHTRGTPPAAVETAPQTWIALATGELTWQQASAGGLLLASGERSDLSPLLPLTPAPADRD